MTGLPVLSVNEPSSDIPPLDLMKAWMEVNAQRMVIEQDLSDGVYVRGGFINRTGLHEALGLMADIERELEAIALVN